ncbi:MAG: DUF2892 domain-containing protein [Hydrogenophilales bacterium]|nr:DUF2892 domain-containing protein [Hydrogenophilales bacterium]
MFYVKNLPGWERWLRVGGGVVMAVYALMSVAGIVGGLLVAAGIGTALSGVLGFCPMCALAGRRLAKRARG